MLAFESESDKCWKDPLHLIMQGTVVIQILTKVRLSLRGTETLWRLLPLSAISSLSTAFKPISGRSVWHYLILSSIGLGQSPSKRGVSYLLNTGIFSGRLVMIGSTLLSSFGTNHLLGCRWGVRHSDGQHPITQKPQDIPTIGRPWSSSSFVHASNIQRLQQQLTVWRFHRGSSMDWGQRQVDN